MFKILCLDGGGLRGYFTAQIIKNIEKRYNIKVNEYFDLVVGTSTGALIAGALAIDINVDEIINMYIHENKNIFKDSMFKKGIFSSKYDITTLNDLVKKAYKGKNFSDAKCNLIITTTNVNDSQPLAIASFDKNNNISLIDAVTASSAAPIYFRPHKINNNYYCDGCIWANNPSVIALSHALDKKVFNKKIKDIALLSVGTLTSDAVSFDVSNNTWGMLSWGKNISSLFLKTNVIASENIVSSILGENFLRINFISNDKMNINEIPSEILLDTDRVFSLYENQLDIFFKKCNKENIFKKVWKNLFKIRRK